MSVLRKRHTKADSIYTWRQDLIIRVNKPVYIKEIIRVASGLNVNFERMDLSDMNAQKLVFYYQNAVNSKLVNGNYSKSKFGRSLFMESDCSDSCFEKSDFRMSVFSESKFVNSNLQNCDLKRSFFIGVDFTNANLRGCDLRACTLVGSILDGADLRDTNIEGVDFTDCEMNFTKIDRNFKTSFNGLN